MAEYFYKKDEILKRIILNFRKTKFEQDQMVRKQKEDDDLIAATL
jgi:hypothetical protein